MKKLPQNGEKRSQNRENLHKAIYVNFLKKKLLSPHKVFLNETLYFELPKILVICFKGTLASCFHFKGTLTLASCCYILQKLSTVVYFF